MRKNKSLSSFSLAAVALLVAAVPSFPQSQSSGSLAEVKTGLLTPGSGLERMFSQSRSTAPGTGLLFVEPKRLLDTAHVVTSSTLSPAAFKVTSQFIAKEEKFSFDLLPTTYNSKKQFRIDDGSSVERSNRRFSFVPSRGPKMPS